MKDAFGFRRFPEFDEKLPVQLSRSSFKAFIAGIVLFTLLGLFSLVLWLLADMTVYTRQQVRLNQVGQFCFIKDTGRRSKGQITNPTPDCEGLGQHMRQRMRFLNYHLVKVDLVTFTYMSPADGKPYTGMLQRDTNDAGLPAKPGDEITVHTSSLFAGTYTDWSSPSRYDHSLVTQVLTRPVGS